jgi:hypothetical protein
MILFGPKDKTRYLNEQIRLLRREVQELEAKLRCKSCTREFIRTCSVCDNDE